ncbi:MAG: HD domain-containing protein [Clostridia bacterium]|nr:HD domain-containing protein [Clostridia bacterium]
MSEFFIPQNIEFALNRLQQAGFEAYVVGGCVRDMLMKKQPNDYDITTNASPDETMAVFSDMRVIETGLQHGTVTVVCNGDNIEITTYRIDGEYGDNRHPKQVTFTKNLCDDLARRDFTVNAMAYNPSSGLVDIYGGREDIKNRVIRCVGKPDLRFSEDGLRILRALRFASVLDFSIDKETSESIHKNSHLLKNISSERIFSEFTKLLCGSSAHIIIKQYSDVICRFIPELEPCIGFEQKNIYHIYDVFGHTLKAIEESDNDKIVRLAVFFHDLAKPAAFDGQHFHRHPQLGSQMAENILRRLKADNETIRIVSLLILYHDRDIIPTERSVKRLLRLMSFEDARRLMKVKYADIMAHSQYVIDKMAPDIKPINELIDRIEAQGDCISLKTLAIGGKELIALGLDPGKRIGTTLDRLLDAVIDGQIENRREELITYAKQLISEQQSV